MRSILLFLALAVSLTIYAQSNVNNEEFEFSFLTTKAGAQCVFNGKAHAFTIDIVSDSIKTTQHPNYFIVGKRIVQVSAIPLQPTTIDLSRLTIEQQEQALSGYVDYEMDYFNNELKLNCQNIKKEWITINSKLWIMWSFDATALSGSEEVSQKTKGQVYSSTICFNQVLDLNIPLFEKDDMATSKALMNTLMSTLVLMDKRL